MYICVYVYIYSELERLPARGVPTRDAQNLDSGYSADGGAVVRGCSGLG